VRQGWDETNKAEEMKIGSVYLRGVVRFGRQECGIIIFKTLLLLIMTVMTVEDLHERPCPAQQPYTG
jgi:hypothetical protein